MLAFVLFSLCFITFTNLNSSEINIYFTDPYYNPTSLSRLSTKPKRIDFALKEFICSATPGATIYMCIYEINNTTITTAIDTVVKNNVNVYCIFHTTKTTRDISHILARFTTSSYSNFKSTGIGPSPLMHNKFVVLKSSKVWTGSYNFTVSATYEQDNFALEIFSKKLAEIYEKAFWYIWGQIGDVKEFNGESTTFSDGTKITVYFNPYAENPKLFDVLVSNLYDLEEKPKIENLYFAVAWFTMDTLASCLIKLYNCNVRISGIIDDRASGEGIVYTMLRKNGIDVWLDARQTDEYGGNGLMHHKFCILDPYGERPKVICGSANWTRAALTPSSGNYENLLVIESRRVAEVFYKEFLRLYNKAVSQQVTPTTDELIEEILFYPNPARAEGSLNIKFRPAFGVKEIKFLLVSLYGVKIFEKNLDFVANIENKTEVNFKTEVNLPADMNNGLYYAILRAKSSGYSKDYVKKIIIRK